MTAVQSLDLIDTLRFRALGTEVLVVSPAASALADEVQALVEQYEGRFSRFRPSSEVEWLSQRTGGESTVSDDLFEVLSLARSFWLETGGLFDPLIRPELEAAGYDRSFEFLPRSCPHPPLPRRPERPTFGSVRLNADRRSVRLPAGGRLDLGGIAKGWIVDRLADLLTAHGPFLVDIGGDMVARGTGPDGGPGWLIAVADPYRMDADCCWVRLEDRAIATSTTMRRRWLQGGRWLHHLIDPRSGRPADSDLAQVTVIAPTTVAADVYAKTALLLGREDGFHWLAERSLPGLLVAADETIRTPEWQQFEVPDADV